MMWKRSAVAHVAVVVAVAMLVACGGEQAQLVSPRIDGASAFRVGGPRSARVHPLYRQTGLAAELRWGFDVGPAGTIARNPATGLTITVPAGAVSTPTHITVIALRGEPLAYRFEPHGLQFPVPIQLTQTLRGLRLTRISVMGPQLLAGYFAEDSLVTDAVTGDVRVSELLPVEIDAAAHSAILQIHHFSGYTVASAAKDTVVNSR
ncbi:MAG TPA: hypothetical protein VH539_16630 [Gemmatimonadaceae bacterium]|jgi:hypothetical protein